MASDESSSAGNSGNDDDLRVECATVLFELRIAIEASIAGIKRIATRPAAAPLQGELGILLRLIEQGAEALNILDGVLECVLRPRTETANDA